MFWNSTIYPKQINHRVYQIHKEGGVVKIFLTAWRHFWTPWSERTHCMENGQSFFFSPASHARRACEARALRSRKTITPRFTYFFTHFERKKRKRLFCSLPLHGREKFSFLGLPTLITRCHLTWLLLKLFPPYFLPALKPAHDLKFWTRTRSWHSQHEQRGE